MVGAAGRAVGNQCTGMHKQKKEGGSIPPIQNGGGGRRRRVALPQAQCPPSPGASSSPCPGEPNAPSGAGHGAVCRGESQKKREGRKEGEERRRKRKDEEIDVATGAGGRMTSVGQGNALMATPAFFADGAVYMPPMLAKFQGRPSTVAGGLVTYPFPSREEQGEGEG